MMGRVVRFCLLLGVIPVFTTPCKQGFQGKIERFNSEIQRKFWRRKDFKNIRYVKDRLKEYVLEHRLRQQSTIVIALQRRTFPKKWKYDETKLNIVPKTIIQFIFVERMNVVTSPY
jgi:hypothetical protein